MRRKKETQLIKKREKEKDRRKEQHLTFSASQNMKNERETKAANALGRARSIILFYCFSYSDGFELQRQGFAHTGGGIKHSCERRLSGGGRRACFVLEPTFAKVPAP
jgi:hypothetical protein